MILETTIAAKVNKRGKEQASRVLEAQGFRYLDSEISNAIEREIIRETVARAPAWNMTSGAERFCVIEIAATKPI